MLNLTPSRARATDLSRAQRRASVIEALRRFADRVAATEPPARPRPQSPEHDEPSPFWILHAR